MAKEKTPSTPLGRGLDIGTMNLCAARKTADNKVETKKLRDAFLDLSLDAKKMLKLSNVNFIERGESLIILGDHALSMANVMNKEVRRPLHAGLISSREHDAFEILSVMIEHLLGKPETSGEPVYYSIPAAPIDRPDQDVVYHESIFKKIVEELGYTGVSMHEALSICFAEGANDQFSGLYLSFGAGMVNVSLVFRTQEALAFSVARSGDWVDSSAARALNTTASKIAAIKEKEFKTGSSLVDWKKGDPKNARAREAISVYYKALIEYALTNIISEFKKIQGTIELPEAIPCVVSGGTTMPDGFVELFKQVLEEKKGFPLEISEVRQASDPLMSVAKGLLVAATMHDDE